MKSPPCAVEVGFEVAVDFGDGLGEGGGGVKNSQVSCLKNPTTEVNLTAKQARLVLNCDDGKPNA